MTWRRNCCKHPRQAGRRFCPHDPIYEELVKWLFKSTDFLYLGRGIHYPDRAGRRAEAEGDLLHPRRRAIRRAR